MVPIVSYLEDFLAPLNHGIWEVIVPKVSVSEPLGPAWERSRINIPSPGTIASYRKGQFHAHETKTEWRIHLDRFDPKRHPILHLIDDAPLLLMIGDTFNTLVSGARKKTGDEEQIRKDQTKAWRDQVLAGLFCLFIGIFIVRVPWLSFQGITLLLIPLAILGLGALTIWRSVSLRPFRILEPGLLYRGMAISAIGIIASYLSLDVWVAGMLGVFGVWMLASAIVLLARARKGRSAIPEGFVSRVAIACLSLALVALIVIDPLGVVILLMVIVGVLAIILGITLLINGMRLKGRMQAV
jgi:uncharacterized membrane protein HdeD (DUF308 family)